MTNTKITMVSLPHKEMTIDRAAFKYMIHYEIAKFEDKELTSQTLNELYFEICRRFEPYFKEIDKDEDL